MSTTIAAGASQTVTLAQGYKIDITGTGVAVLGPGPQAGLQIGINNSGSVGPFPRAQTVYLTAATALAYDVHFSTPQDAGVVPDAATPDVAELTLSQVAGIKALVSGGGIPASITYDTAGRVSTVTSASGTVYTYAYSATSGLLSTITGGGITQTFNYGADGTLSSVVNS